jgi:hypothetical protein
LALRWTTLEKVPRVGAVRRCLYLAAKALGVGPVRCYLVLSLQWALTAFPGDMKPPGLDICGGADRSGTYSPGTGSPPAQVSRAGLRCWAVTGVPWYHGYKTPTVALEPFVERVVRVVRSTGGRIGTHMLLWVLAHDRVMTMGCCGTTGVVTCDRSRDLLSESGHTCIISVCNR